MGWGFAPKRPYKKAEMRVVPKDKREAKAWIKLLDGLVDALVENNQQFVDYYSLQGMSYALKEAIDKNLYD